MPPKHFKLGNWLHSLMAAHYRDGNYEAQHEALVKEWNSLFLEEREMYGDLPNEAKRLMDAYLYHWREEESSWKVIWAEETFEVNFEEGDVYTFKPDLIVKEGNEYWVVDHKSTSSIPDAEWRLFDLQSTLYSWALREAGIADIKGFIFNYIRTKEPTVPSINIDGAISKRRIDTDFHTLATFLLDYYAVDRLSQLPKSWQTQLKALKTAPSKFFKRSRITKDQALINRQVEELTYTAQEMEAYLEMERDEKFDPWVRTTIPPCEWDCEYHDLCLVQLLGGDGEFLIRTKFQGSQYVKERDLGN